MPYVTVWIEPADAGDCEQCAATRKNSDRITTAIEEALDLLEDGKPYLAARELRAAIGRDTGPDPMERAFDDWTRAGRPGPFWDWSHGRRACA